ncbi:hypothetical protein N7U66_05770 [Lacinutrix neustonica]|uniref:Uncharacterized protein n=1 Tax=Lacinutrix neustonica TaxID=2980107 RepID=A0A9E8SEE6_9FLAO|nr:hypothetical protein [Lacinutrix neustonica]WAC03126.1 hypothetical protein N7U66_05770 [Lacinutrix neustonica]
MIFNTTYTDKKTKVLINDLLGKPYSFMQSIKMKGTGSKRMIVDEVSPSLHRYLNIISDINYANIELRPSGILIHINQGLKNFSWAIPYYHLVIYKTNGSSIHAQGKFIHFRNSKTFKENKSFFDRLFALKVNFDEQYKFMDQ